MCFVPFVTLAVLNVAIWPVTTGVDSRGQRRSDSPAYSSSGGRSSTSCAASKEGHPTRASPALSQRQKLQGKSLCNNIRAQLEIIQ
ncbi:hypothetical protein JTE90_023581 [Oedothorax gibbosus]|uniref:Secreted protein n=1 Tax=Oedothorax gibbosus TaxID=931172 RepID=A0AAV6TLE2_9ARAC|nr:hypothetical protein JTE90_023581 [Oedothorax gibbosus]